MKPSDGTEAARLLFSWQKPRGLLTWLPWFVSISLLAHIGTFFLFSVVYPDRATIPAAPPQITLLSPSNPENIALLQWIEAHDPAKINAPPDLASADLVKATYRPSYQIIRTAPRGVPSERVSAANLPEMEPLSIIRSAAAPVPPPGLRIEKQPTQITFSTELVERLKQEAPAFTAERSATPLEVARFMIGVTDRGEVRFCLLQQSSGNAQLDAEAASHLAKLPFHPSSQKITWGFASFAWGDDAYSKAAPATEN